MALLRDRYRPKHHWKGHEIQTSIKSNICYTQCMHLLLISYERYYSKLCYLCYREKMKSKPIRAKAKSVASRYCLAIRACTQGSQLKWMHDGKIISAKSASQFYDGLNRSALGRYLTTPKYAAFKKAVLGADFGSDRTPEGIEVIANTIFTMVQHVATRYCPV